MATSLSYSTNHNLQSTSTTTTTTPMSSVGQMYLRGSGAGRFTASPPPPPPSLPSPTLEEPSDEANIVVEWLTFLKLEHYSKDFIDNGYDDLETLKRVGPADLDAIGVVSVHHRSFILDAVRVLREQGAAWVYLLLGARERAIADLQHQQQQQQVLHHQHQHLLAVAAQQQQQSDYDRVSASSGIASASSMPWPEDQELSGSSCDCDQCPSTTGTATGSRPQSHRGSRNASGRRQRKNQQQSLNGRQQQNSGGNFANQPNKQQRCSPVSSSNSPSPLGGDGSQCNPATASTITSASSTTTTIGGRASATPSMLEHASCLTEMTDCPSEFSSISNQLNRRVSGSRLSSRTIGSTRSTGRSSTVSRRIKEQVEPNQRFHHDGHQIDQGPDVIQLAPSTSVIDTCDPHVLRLQRQLHKLRLQHYPSQCAADGFMSTVQLRALVRDRLSSEGIRLSSPPYTSSTAGGNDGYLLNLASRYSEDLGISYLDVLQQLEDLRLAEWSEVTPPAPPPTSASSSMASMKNENVVGGTSYVNFNPAASSKTSNGTKSRYLNGDSIYVPGTYTPSSCLSDRDGDQIYDYATKYRHQMRQNQAKMLMSPQGWIQMAKKIISKGSSSNGASGSSKSHKRGEPQQPRYPPRSSISESNIAGMCNNNGTHRKNRARGENRESGISLTPDTLGGRMSPDGGVTVYKTKVLYHSRADFRSSGLTSQNGQMMSQNGHPTFYGDREGAI